MTCTIERKAYKLARPYFLMEEPDLEAGLKRLRNSLHQIKALLAWRQMKETETWPHEPPGFRIADPVEADLRNEYSFFLATALQIQSVLNDSSAAIAEAKRQSIKIQMAGIEQQLYSLNLNQKPCTY